MKVWQYQSYGNSSVLFQSEKELKISLRRNWVVVKVNSISINPLDYKIMEGQQRPISNFYLPFTPGTDFSGTIHAIASKDSYKFNLKPGDRVYGMVNPIVTGGTASEFLKIPLKYIAKIPEHMSFHEAAASPTAGITALMSLKPWLSMRELEKLLVNLEYLSSLKRKIMDTTFLVTGAGGGVGHMICKLLIMLGAKIISLSSRSKFDFLKSLGIKTTFDYKQRTIMNLISDLKKDGETFILKGLIDSSGAISLKDYQLVYKSIKPYNISSGFAFSRISVENSHILSAFWLKLFSPYYFHFFLAQPGNMMKILAKIQDQGEVIPNVQSQFTMDLLPEAMAQLSQGHQAGKIVLSWK